MHNFLDCGTEYLTKILKNIKNQFWLDVFNAHIELQSNNQPKEIHEFQASALFYNKNIKVANTSIYYQACYERGIKLINDITGKNGNLLTYQEVKELFNIKINFLQYHGLCNAIKEWKKRLKINTINEKLQNPIVPFGLHIYMRNKKGTKDMYKILNSNNETPAGKIAWKKIFNFSEEEWKKIYKWPFEITNNTTLQWFQSRINHNILATNKYLHKIKLINNPTCSFCTKEPETVEHLLWDCEHTQKILYDFKDWCESNNTSINLQKQSFLFGVLDNKTSIVEQQILLEIKYYIYFCRCTKAKLNVTALKCKLKLLYCTNERIAILENKYEQFVNSWENFSHAIA